MTEDQARAQLERMVAHDSAPTLDSDEIDALMAIAETEGGWDLDAGAAEGWRRKAGATAGSYTFSVDSQLSRQGEVHANCLAMAEYYESRTQSSFTVLAIRSPYAETVADDTGDDIF